MQDQENIKNQEEQENQLKEDNGAIDQVARCVQSCA